MMRKGVVEINSCTYVDSWKKARITPIFKSEDRQKCDNYRPISILSIISKIFKKEVFDLLYEHLSQNLLLSININQDFGQNTQPCQHSSKCATSG